MKAIADVIVHTLQTLTVNSRQMYRAPTPCPAPTTTSRSRPTIQIDGLINPAMIIFHVADGVARQTDR